MSIFWKAVNEKYALKIEHDTTPQNPRKEFDNLATMVCWHRRYDLGDKHSYKDPEDFIVSLACDFEKTEQSQKLIRKFMQEEFKDVKIVQGDSGAWYLEKDGKNYEYGRYLGTKKLALKHLRELKEDWIHRATDNMSIAQLREMIESHVVMLPLYLYDHSGITMSTGSFSCQWDSGQVGWIYCSKERLLKETGYTEDQLFGTRKNNNPKKGDMVKVKGHEDKRYGQVLSVRKGMVKIDWSYKYTESMRNNPELTGMFKTDQITEIMGNYAEQMLESEVTVYDDYLTGAVYGFTLYTIDREGLNEYLKENETTVYKMDWDDLEPFLDDEDSCWGFYGDDHETNGMADHFPKEALPLLKELKQGRIVERTVLKYA